MMRHDSSFLIDALDEHHIAGLLVQVGRMVLLPLFAQQDFDRHCKRDSSLVTESDTRCQQWLQQQLQQHSREVLPDFLISFMGEEMSEQEQRDCLHHQSTYWCVDPLDGTGNYAGNIPMFAISLALIHQGCPLMAWIHDPCREETFSATSGSGLKLNGCRVAASPQQTSLQRATGYIDFKRLPRDQVHRWAVDKVYRSQRNLGSCALEWAWLAAGRGDFIIHGGQRLWDYAAGVLLCEEAGGVVSDLQGEHPFDSLALSSSIVAANTPLLHQALLEQSRSVIG